MLKLVQFREHHKLVRIVFCYWHKVPHLWRSYNSYSLSVRHSTVLTLKTSISWQWKPSIECVFDRVGSAAESSRIRAGLPEEVVIIHLHLVSIGLTTLLLWKWSVSQKNTLQNKGRSLVSGRRTERNWRLWQVEHILRMLKITLVRTAGFYGDFREVQPREEWEGALLLVLKPPSFFHYFRALKKPPVTYSILNRVLLVFVTLTKFVPPLTTN